MSRANPFSPVLRRVRALGFESHFVRDVGLPPWWENEIACHPTGLEEGVGLLSVRLGLVPASLRDGDAAEFAADVEPKFKMRAGVERSALEPLRHVATYALRLACAAAPAGGAFPSTDPVELRQHLLAGGAPWVTLESLLGLCWASGVPVLHIGAKVGKKKMDGLAARFGDCHGIALCANLTQPSRLLFILAHELGHVLLGHLPHDGVLIDGEGIVSVDTDTEEEQANDFAWALLTGSNDYDFSVFPKAKAPQITRECRVTGERDGISPGLLAAHHGYKTKMWGAVNLALKSLEPDSDALASVRAAAEESLDLSRLPDGAAEYLGHLIGLRPHTEAA